MTIAADLLSIQDTVNKYVVTPANAFGIGGFVFDIEGTAIANLNSDITDHYSEDNNFFQDHIAVRPKRITLKNYVGELVNRLDDNTNSIPQVVTQKLTTLFSYLPVLTQGAQQVSSFLDGNFSFKQAVDSPSLTDAASLYGAVKNLLPPTSAQQRAYLFFKAMQQQKLLVSVQTPFEFMVNMAVESIIFTQREDTRFMSDFTITLKEMRFASVKTNLFDPSKFKSPINSNSNINDTSISPGLGAVVGLPTNRQGEQIEPAVRSGTIQGVSVPAGSFSNVLKTSGLTAGDVLSSFGIK